MADKSKEYILKDVVGLTAIFDVKTYIKTTERTLTLKECEELAKNYPGMTMRDKDNAEQARLALAQMNVPVSP